MIGQTLGHYRIESKLGQGGMGVVYRASDMKLGREVAIKVLPQDVARDADRMARFEREAHLLASLNHPNIAAIYSLEQAEGIPFLVLELVPGPTLAELLASGPLETEEVLRIAAQIAEALEAAHEKGIIHRDLKPANVKVTPEDKVKVLDFGLAKAFADDPAGTDPSQSPTVTVATRTGVILGTAAYMSPEQTRGRPLDRRTDIWSFGCVLYELLAGRRAFEADSVSDTLAAILKQEPDWNRLPAATPPVARVLLRRCLEKDRHRRLRDVGDARLEIEEARGGRAEPGAGTAGFVPRRRIVAFAALALVAVVAAAVGGVLLGRRPPVAKPAARLVAPLGLADRFDTFLPTLALSPDGARLVYALQSGERTPAVSRLYLRRLDQFEATPIPGTEGAVEPFFSPDGEWIGFFAGGKLKKVSLNGGVPIVLCDAPNGRGGSWAPDNTIVFAPQNTPATGISRVSAAGGIPQALTTPDASKDESNHRFPEILPGGRAVLFTIEPSSGDYTGARVAVLSLQSGERRVLIEGGTGGRYVAADQNSTGTGWLLFAQEEGLAAAPFDPVRLRLTGQAVPVGEPVTAHWGTGAAHFAVSTAGSLAYLPERAAADGVLVWVDRAGSVTPISKRQATYGNHQISPDGKRIAVVVRDGTKRDVWMHDIERDTLSPLTHDGKAWGGSGPGVASVLWTPDGKRVVYSSKSAGAPNLYWRAADGSGAEERLAASPNSQGAGSWSPDGKWLAFTEAQTATAEDIWLLPMEPNRKPQPFLVTPFSEGRPRISPDGRSISYYSRESGSFQIYVRPFPGAGPRIQVSTEGDNFISTWAPNGKELFYQSGTKVMAVEVRSQPELAVGKPRLLFDRPDLTGNLDVAPDGRFIMIQRGEQTAAPAQINVVLNFSEELQHRFGAPKK